MPPPRKSKGKGRARDTGLDANGRPAKIKRVKEVVFDPDARKEYLTGFSKRKKAKQAERRNRAISREKDALRQMRTQVREQRKEQAAHNVRMAKEAYGDADGDEEDDDDESGSEDGSGSGSGSDSDADGGDERELAFEAPDGDLATVVVEPLSLSRSPTPEPLPPAPSTSSAPKPRPAQQTSMYKKRVKNTVQARPKMSREDKKARATGGKKVKKQMANRMKGTKGRAAK
ncbi:nucleolar protein 12-domain-containing protein [Rhodotorula diobovata]|uniref:Nucleolar protein 12-domain-containing protein n=1 Tax=Rhodotorula diobovata TaxID=5288 RepID=A0A5C5G1Z7_9BASI|nr:nucleolar protein 12-domain-containing protein [Rhodotorula diobovata]